MKARVDAALANSGTRPDDWAEEDCLVRARPRDSARAEMATVPRQPIKFRVTFLCLWPVTFQFRHPNTARRTPIACPSSSSSSDLIVSSRARR